MIRSKLRDSIRGPERRSRGLVTLVAGDTARALGSLLQCIHGQHTEADRQGVAHRHLIEATSRLPGDIVEVGSLSADDGSKSNQARIAPGLCCSRRTRSQLECAGQPDNVDLVTGDPGFAAARERTIEELPGDEFVVAAYQDRHSPGGAKAAGEVRHGQWVNKWPSLSRLTCR
jgi:hypothetical protein